MWLVQCIVGLLDCGMTKYEYIGCALYTSSIIFPLAIPVLDSEIPSLSNWNDYRNIWSFVSGRHSLSSNSLSIFLSTQAGGYGCGVDLYRNRRKFPLKQLINYLVLVKTTPEISGDITEIACTLSRLK
jgi:hypothetical protein